MESHTLSVVNAVQSRSTALHPIQEVRNTVIIVRASWHIISVWRVTKLGEIRGKIVNDENTNLINLNNQSIEEAKDKNGNSIGINIVI